MNPLKWWTKPEPAAQPVKTETKEPETFGPTDYTASMISGESTAVEWTKPEPAKGVIPEGFGYAKGFAFDSAPGQFQGISYGESSLPYIKPMSFGELAVLSMDGLIRRGVSALASNMVRKWIELQHTGDENPELLKEITDLLEKYKVRKKFGESATSQGFFGGCFLFIDMGDDQNSPEWIKEAKTPLLIDNKKIKKGSFKGLTLIEPWTCAPYYKNTTTPTASDYYNPETWWIMGREIHHTRLLRFVQNEVPIYMKPMFFGFGISQAQLVLDYVETFYDIRKNTASLVDNYSLFVLKTNMGQALKGSTPEQRTAGTKTLSARIRMFNMSKKNMRTVALSKDDEDISQVTTPLSGISDILSKNFEFVAALFAMPVTELLGISPSGFNSTGDNEKKTWHERVLSMQELMFSDNLRKVIDIVQISEYGEIDKNVTFAYKPLAEMDEAQKSTIRSQDATTDVTLVTGGVISTEEARVRLRDNPDSGYSGINPNDVPSGGEDDPEDKSAIEELYSQIGLAQDSEFKESEHPREESGQFGSGGKKRHSGKVHRYTGQKGKKKSSDNGLGMMMYTDNEESVKGSYGNNHYVADLDGIPDDEIIDAGSKEFKDGVKAALLKRWNKEILQQYGDDEDDDETIANKLASEFNPEDIVNSAGSWDAPDVVRAVYEDYLEGKGYTAVRTTDGFISFNPKHGKKAKLAQDSAHWITLHGGKEHESGSHVMVDGDGKIIAGAGGKLDGKKFSPKSKSDDVMQHSARPQQTVKKPENKTDNKSLSDLHNKKENGKLPSEGQESTTKSEGDKMENAKFGKYTVNHEKGTIEVDDDPSHPWGGDVSGTLSDDGKFLECGEVRLKDGRSVQLNIRLEGKPELQAAAAEIQQAKVDKAAKKKAALPNLSEIEKISGALENAHYAYQSKSEYGYPHKEAAALKAAEEAMEAARARYPAEAAYLKAKSYTESHNIDKNIAGRKALEAISSGEDYKKAIEEMEKEWSDRAMGSVMNN